MITYSRRSPYLLFIGDLVAFIASLYITLWIRYSHIPTATTLAPYVVPFSFLFALWLVVFYSAGLYSKRLALFPSRLPDSLLTTQTANIIFAAVFFFLIPAFGITPKTILVLYLIVSLALVFFWRVALYPRFSAPKRRERAILIAQGEEADEMRREVNGNLRYGIEFMPAFPESILAEPTHFQKEIEKSGASILVVDTAHAEAGKLLPLIYTLSQVERRFQFVVFEDLYEEIFDRIPLSRLEHGWFLENVAPSNPFLYRAAKRVIDIIGAFLMGVVTIVILPFIFIANLFEGPGPLFLRQQRYGEREVPIKVYKFRSMQKDISASGEWTHEGENRVTKVGAFLRKTSLDEFPQFVNVLAGEISLVGPRNDTLGLGNRLAEALPYYEARYLVRPGITGWAQINQQYEPGNVSPQSIQETKTRLAYDFYYLKHRSLGLDILIALRTIKRMFFRVSSW